MSRKRFMTREMSRSIALGAIVFVIASLIREFALGMPEVVAVLVGTAAALVYFAASYRGEAAGNHRTE